MELDETSCPLYKLGHDDEEIEGRYKVRSYFIKCKQHKIKITAQSSYFGQRRFYICLRFIVIFFQD